VDEWELTLEARAFLLSNRYLEISRNFFKLTGKLVEPVAIDECRDIVRQIAIMTNRLEQLVSEASLEEEDFPFS